MSVKKQKLILDVVLGYLNAGESIRSVAGKLGYSYQNIYQFLENKKVKKIVRWEKS